LFNFLLAIAIFFGLFASFGRPVIVNGQAILKPRISSVDENRAGAAAGFLPGDMVESVDGQNVESFAQFQRLVSAAAGRTLHILVLRGEREASLIATPDEVESDSPTGKIKVGRLGLKSSEDFRDMRMQPCSVPEAMGLAVKEPGPSSSRPDISSAASSRAGRAPASFPVRLA